MEPDIKFGADETINQEAILSSIRNRRLIVEGLEQRRRERKGAWLGILTPIRARLKSIYYRAYFRLHPSKRYSAFSFSRNGSELNARYYLQRAIVLYKAREISLSAFQTVVLKACHYPDVKATISKKVVCLSQIKPEYLGL